MKGVIVQTVHPFKNPMKIQVFPGGMLSLRQISQTLKAETVTISNAVKTFTVANGKYIGLNNRPIKRMLHVSCLWQFLLKSKNWHRMDIEVALKPIHAVNGTAHINVLPIRKSPPRNFDNDDDVELFDEEAKQVDTGVVLDLVDQNVPIMDQIPSSSPNFVSASVPVDEKKQFYEQLEAQHQTHFERLEARHLEHMEAYKCMFTSIADHYRSGLEVSKKRALETYVDSDAFAAAKNEAVREVVKSMKTDIMNKVKISVQNAIPLDQFIDAYLENK